MRKMKTDYRLSILAAALCVSFASPGAMAAAEQRVEREGAATSAGAAADQQTQSEGGTASSGVASTRGMDKEEMQRAAQSARENVKEAVEVVREMEREEGLPAVLRQARGIFILPDYGRGGLVVGARGGEGVLLVKRGQQWSDPLFYNLGGISVGAQAGAEGGSIAMILNSERAVQAFMQNNNFSINADAGLTVVNWSAKAQASAGKGDVVVWSNAKGLFGDLAISVTGINFDEEETAAYYGRQVAMRDVVSGRVKGPGDAAGLKRALTAAASGRAASVGSDRPAGEAGRESREQREQHEQRDSAR